MDRREVKRQTDGGLYLQKKNIRTKIRLFPVAKTVKQANPPIGVNPNIQALQLGTATQDRHQRIRVRKG